MKNGMSLSRISRHELNKKYSDLYEENYATSPKCTKLDLNKWKDTPYSCLERLNIIYMTLFPKLIYKFNVIQMKTGAILVD